MEIVIKYELRGPGSEYTVRPHYPDFRYMDAADEQFGQDKIYQINAFLLQLYGCHTYPNTFALHQSVRISVASL